MAASQAKGVYRGRRSSVRTSRPLARKILLIFLCSYREGMVWENAKKEHIASLVKADAARLTGGIGPHLIGATFQALCRPPESGEVVWMSYIVIGMRTAKCRRGPLYMLDVRETDKEIELSEQEMKDLWARRVM